jgi:hypothetical protein
MADEKSDEKDREKSDEKSAQEKSWEEKWQRDPLGTIVWACIFIWAGLVFLADNLGYLDRIRIVGFDIPGFNFIVGLEVWSVIFIGAGVIVLLEALVRLLVPAYRKPIGGTVFFGILLIGIGLGNLIGWNLVWPILLIGLGISILLRGYRSRE